MREPFIALKSPLERIKDIIANGDFSGIPNECSLSTKQDFCNKIRFYYNHIGCDQDIMAIFDKAWETGKHDWYFLAVEYDNITREHAPHTLIDLEALRDNIIDCVDVYMLEKDFLQHEKQKRHEIITSFIKNKVYEKIVHDDYTNELILNIIEHYELLYGCDLKKYIDINIDIDIDYKSDNNIIVENINNVTKSQINNILTMDFDFLGKLLVYVNENKKTDEEIKNIIEALYINNSDNKIFSYNTFNELFYLLNDNEIENLRILSGIKK